MELMEENKTLKNFIFHIIIIFYIKIYYFYFFNRLRFNFIYNNK